MVGNSRAAVIILLLIFCLVSIPESANADVEGFVEIKADGNVYPSDAPIRRNGDIYTLTGDIAAEKWGPSAGISIEKDNIVLDGAGYTLQGGSNYGILLEVINQSFF